MACPLKFGMAKSCPKFGAISDNFRLLSRISPKRTHKSKIGKIVDQRQPLPRWTKKDRELWSTNEKVIDVHIDPPKWTLFGRLYFGPYGVMRPQIFIRARDCRKLANAYLNWDGVPPPKKKYENLKFGLKWEYSQQTFSGHVMNFGPQTKKL